MRLEHIQETDLVIGYHYERHRKVVLYTAEDNNERRLSCKKALDRDEALADKAVRPVLFNPSYARHQRNLPRNQHTILSNRVLRSR